MLPSERAERWVRRVGLAGLILVALFILVWLTWFISGIARKALAQRESPPEATAPSAETD